MKLYRYNVNGIEHVAQMDEADAKRLEGATEVQDAAAPKTKARKAPANKAVV